MGEQPMTTWMGKPLTDYTKGELIVIIGQLASYYEGRLATLKDTLRLFRYGDNRTATP